MGASAQNDRLRRGLHRWRNHCLLAETETIVVAGRGHSLEFAERGRRPAERPSTVLVVDDDHDIREAVAECLADAFTVICASNGEEALAYLGANPAPAVILLDLFMPVMDGWEFLRRLTSQTQLSRVPVVLTTAAGDHWGHPVPPAMLVRKPFDLDRLLTVLRSAAGASCT